MAEIELSNELAGFANMVDENSFTDIEHEDGSNSPEEDKTSGEGTQPTEEKQPAEDVKTEDANKEEPEKPSEDETPGKEEPMVPFHRFKESRDSVRQIKEELEALRANRNAVAPSSTGEANEDVDAEKYLEKKLEQAIEQREARLHRESEKQATELTELMEVYGSFDVDKVLGIKAEFKKADAILSNEAALKIYFERGQSKATTKKESSTLPTKPSIPQPQRSASQETAPPSAVDLSKPLSKIVEEAKKEYGLIK